MACVLHVGCGGDTLPDWMGDAEEVRLDIDPSTNPHIVASMTDMGDIGEFDAVACFHSLEHLYPHQVGQALSEFRRVLKPGGYVAIVVPDLEDVRPTEDVVYVGPAGPITGLDMYYGFRPMLQERPSMAHRTGFVRDTLDGALQAAGFTRTNCKRLAHFNLMGVAVK